jgi:hypothetical protein
MATTNIFGAFLNMQLCIWSSPGVVSCNLSIAASNSVWLILSSRLSFAKQICSKLHVKNCSSLVRSLGYETLWPDFYAYSLLKRLAVPLHSVITSLLLSHIYWIFS